MDNSGWISLHRKVKDHWIWRNPSYLKAWIQMILDVNYEEKKVLIEGELIECKRGQSLKSLKSWANDFGHGWTIQKVRTFFKLLENDSMINIEGLRKTTRVTVCKYDSYQNIQHTDNTETTSKQQGDNKETTRRQQQLNKDNKENKENNKIYPYQIMELNEWSRTYFDEKFINEKSLSVFDELTRIDSYTIQEIKDCIIWARGDQFWSSNFLSPAKLRTKDKNGVKYIDVFKAKLLTKNKLNGANGAGAGWDEITDLLKSKFAVNK